MIFKNEKNKIDKSEDDFFYSLIILLSVILLFTIIFAVTFGSVKIQPSEVWGIIVNKIKEFSSNSMENAPLYQIVWNVRLPRVLLGVVVGAGLAVVGVAMQALVQNPLADPYILGVSSGASVGATLFVLTGVFASFGSLGISFFAFFGALASSSLVYFVSKIGGRATPLKFVLAGTAIGSLFSSLTSFIVLRSPNVEGVKSVMFWLMGSLAGAKWQDLRLPTLAVLIGIIILILQYRNLNILLMGDDTATTLGVNLAVTRKILMIFTSILTAIIVCISGTIGFVGIMIPHIVRYMVGSNHKKLLPVSALVGSIFLVWADVIARTIGSPGEIPIGIITSLIGAPFFLWLMVKGSNSFGGSKR